MSAIKFFIILFGIKQLIIIMEEDILTCSPTVMIRGTPCTFKGQRILMIFQIDTFLCSITYFVFQ